MRRQRARLKRRRSADYTHDLARGASYQSLVDAMSSTASLDALLKTVSSVGSMLAPASLKAASSYIFRDDFAVGLGLHQLGRCG